MNGKEESVSHDSQISLQIANWKKEIIVGFGQFWKLRIQKENCLPNYLTVRQEEYMQIITKIDFFFVALANHMFQDQLA